MTQKEKEFCKFMYEENKALAELSPYYKLIHTKDNLLEEIEKQYPEEANIFHKFSYEADYWDNLKTEYETSILLRG